MSFHINLFNHFNGLSRGNGATTESESFVPMRKDREFCVNFIDTLFLKITICRFSVAVKVLDATKTSLAQHFTGIKCQFYLSNNFVYATRTQYEKVQKCICF